MKKILLLSTLIALTASCKDDDDSPLKSSYPTDGLPLNKEYNALLMMGSDNQNPASAAYESFRIMTEDEYGNRLNTFHLLSTNVGNFYDSYGDSIMMNFQSPMAPYTVLDDQDLFPSELPQEVKRSIRQKPLLTVAHKVTQNDTAWIIDHKVKFFEDTIYNEIYIDTYMLAKLKAQIYDADPAPIDLRMAATADLIKNPPTPLPNESQWDLNIMSLDSSKTLVRKGDPFYYDNLLFDKFDSTSTWGFELGSYWPFGSEFYDGDIIGTKETPIRHYFKKPSSENSTTAAYEVKFMSIVWIRDGITGSMRHVNSYTSETYYRYQ